MIRNLHYTAFLFLLGSAASFAELTDCVPARNCFANDKPCYNAVSPGSPGEDLTPAPSGVLSQLRPPVIRVRLCRGEDALCKSGARPQVVNVFGLNDEQEQIFSQTLNTEGASIDTGGYTKLESLSRLRVRCPGHAQCRIVWQICREELPPLKGTLINQDSGGYSIELGGFADSADDSTSSQDLPTSAESHRITRLLLVVGLLFVIGLIFRASRSKT